MSQNTVVLIFFFCFSLGLPLWAMQDNAFEKDGVHACTGDCYTQWQQDTGGVVSIAMAQEAAKASATPSELGEKAYTTCIACHGSRGEGGIGPALIGQSEGTIYDKLVQYKNGETRGTQSALMWTQAATLTDEDMKNIAAFVETLQSQ